VIRRCRCSAYRGYADRNAHLIARHFFQGTVGVQHDIAARHFIHQTFDQDLLRAEGVAAVDQVHFRGDVRQIQRFFHCGVTAADNRDFLVAVEETVAGCAGRNAAAFERFFRRADRGNAQKRRWR
jgi:hypothetical protein